MHDAIFITLALAVGLWMTWGIGANDLANIFSTAIGSKAITVKNALIIALIFETAGALFGGAEVSQTLRGEIIHIDQFANNPEILTISMLSVLLAGATWVTLASWLAMPVSITHSIVGALVGVSAVALGAHTIDWQMVSFIALSWIFSPLLAGTFAWLLFVSIKRSILSSIKPISSSHAYVPFYLFLVGIVLAMMTVLKIIDHSGIQLGTIQQLIIVLLTATIITGCGWLAMLGISKAAIQTRHSRFIYVEKLFSILMGLTACAMVFAHGSNDVAVAVGPISAIVSLIRHGKIFIENNIMTHIITLFGCAGVITGLLVYGRKIIETVGSHITMLTPSRAFAATLSAATVVVLFTGTGIPVSATQTLVGGVLGVGLAGGIDALNLNVIRNIFLSWIITLPIAAAFATGFFYLLHWLTK